MLLHGKPQVRMLVKEIRGGLIVKPPVRGTQIPHLHAYAAGGKLRHHVTHEHIKGPGRHRQKREVSLEELIPIFLRVLAPEDDPPPDVTSFDDPGDRVRLEAWWARIFPRVFRKVEARPVCVLRGPLGQFMEMAFAGPASADWEVDITSYIVHQLGGLPEEELLDTIQETDLGVSSQRRIAFSEDLTKLVVLVHGGFVIDLSFESMARAADELSRLLGFEGYLRSLKRRGFKLVDEKGLGDLARGVAGDVTVERPPQGHCR